ncbi:MAG: hypothetical protein JWM27_792 [Gemmatimonadetes bacterium]|nr:hypothetical protein [Gemmatimonadota bacterium]
MMDDEKPPMDSVALRRGCECRVGSHRRRAAAPRCRVGPVLCARRIAAPEGVGRYSARHVRTVGGMGLVIGSIVALGVLWNAVDAWRVRDHLRSGRFVRVEGTVSPFVAGDREGHKPETWTVQSRGRAFHYEYRRVPGPDFHNPSRRVKDGIRVRIADVDGRIARLEVADRPTGSRWATARAAEPRSTSFPREPSTQVHPLAAVHPAPSRGGRTPQSPKARIAVGHQNVQSPEASDRAKAPGIERRCASLDGTRQRAQATFGPDRCLSSPRDPAGRRLRRSSEFVDAGIPAIPRVRRPSPSPPPTAPSPASPTPRRRSCPSSSCSRPA